MKSIDLALSKFTGPIGLETLPEGMEVRNVFSNELSGSLKLDSLPDTLTEFIAQYNKFSRGQMVEWLVQGYVHSVATSIPAHAV